MCHDKNHFEISHLYLKEGKGCHFSKFMMIEYGDAVKLENFGNEGFISSFFFSSTRLQTKKTQNSIASCNISLAFTSEVDKFHLLSNI